MKFFSKTWSQLTPTDRLIYRYLIFAFALINFYLGIFILAVPLLILFVWLSWR